MSSAIDVAIIGAGPYGLSLAAHLKAAGIPFRIFGKPMESWKERMPPGMLLKSHPWSSSLYDPESSFPLRQYCAERKIPYHDSLVPVPVETFIAYGEAFQARFAPHVEQKLLLTCERGANGFRAIFEDGDVVTTRHLVIAVGVHPFAYVPAIFEGLSPDLWSHSSAYGPLKSLVGKEVVVLGSGSSAIDLAALLHECGCGVSLLARAKELGFERLPGRRRSLPRRMAYPIRVAIYPRSGLGSGWLLKACADAPWLIHALPEAKRLHLARTVLGPLGGAFIRDRVLGKVPLLLGRNLDGIAVRGDKAEIHVTKNDGTKQSLQADHIIAATGYKVDLRRLKFLPQNILSGIDAVENTPILSPDYETSSPGLYFIGAASLNSFGPVARFVFGAGHPARRLARTLSRKLSHRAVALAKVTAFASGAQR
jgi:thioredoxin reductase